MKLRKLIEGHLIILIVFLIGTTVCAFDDEISHPKITTVAAKSPNSNIETYLIQNFGNQFSKGMISIVKNKTILTWLQEGSTAEDHPMCQAANHFHNPLLPWNASQMSDDSTPLAYSIREYCNTVGWPYIYRKSNVTWATGYLSPSPEGYKYMFLSSESPLPMNWDTARTSYYSALTGNNGNGRDADFATTFSALGHVLHLLQDMAVPAHVRNDFQSHLISTGVNNGNPVNWYSNPFELYVKNHTALVTDVTITPSFSNTRITDFWDTNQYNGSNPSTLKDIGLAEFTNANYFSNYTIPNNGTTPEHTFPYPHIGVANISGPNYQVCSYQFLNVASINYVSRTNSGSCPTTAAAADHFAVVSLMNMPGTSSDINSISHVWLTDEVHKQYAQELLPRAVGYSSALLDYFFRGTLEISFPTAAVYSIADGSNTPYTDANGNQHQQFTKIKASVMNTTPNNEAIRAGELRAVARYKIIPNYAADLSNYPPSSSLMNGDGTTEHPPVQYSYSVSLSIPVNDGDIIPGYYTDFDFNFSNAPIPAGITDLTLQVVFKGTIGNEADNAIAVGMKDLMEPTHLTFWNSSDMFDVMYSGSTYSLYTFEQLQNKAAAEPAFLTFLDFNASGSLNDDLLLQPFGSTFTISFWDGFAWSSATTVDIPPAGHIRLIALVDSTDNNYVNMAYTYQGDSSSSFFPFDGVVNQADQSGNYPPPTAVKTFRKWRSADGVTFIPFIQHFSKTVFGCYPVQTVDANGNQASCPYPDDEAQPVESLTPIPFTSIFD